MININCCICNKIFNVTTSEYSEWGNNPEPVTPYEDEQGDELRCCDRCNTEVVVPQRMKEMGLR